ncbi:hypothetical protein FRC01_001607 [Tulasnella sp. 417]|nr:hypothetical protein FRC01_001607 [Tulasnella sp. 417]
MSSFFRRQQNDQGDDTDEDNQVDPELRLRTTQTAHSTISESIRQENRRAARRRKSRKWGSKGLFKSKHQRTVDDDLPRPTEPLEAPQDEQPGGPQRRRIHVNVPLPLDLVSSNGDPKTDYVRNKVRTTKYTLLTFVPKNLYEQFRRVANLYFLVLVVVQVWPIFGAAAPQVAMLPLVVILMATAVKDGVEDYRRSTLDDEVNNSAATKLGAWRNVNQPKDPRTWLEKLLGIGSAPDRVTKGVRKLREKEAAEGKNIVLVKNDSESVTSPNGQDGTGSISESTLTGARQRSLEDIQSVGSHSFSLDQTHNYPPIPGDPLATSAATLQANVKDAIEQSGQFGKGMGYSTTSFKSSIKTSGGILGVVDWSRQVTGTARWERTLWKKLEVGDIVLLREDDQIPADIVVLSTSDADGLCYVETKNLDGETNLKPRRSLKATSNMTSEEDIEHSAFILDSEPPHANLYNYNGVLRFRTRNGPSELGLGEDKMEPVTINELLLRGCTVRNTNWIIGLVAFTGADTKIMLNGGDTPSKRSKIERETNFNVIMNFIILMCMVVLTAVVNGYYDGKRNTSAAVYEIDADVSSSHVLNAVVTGVSCLIAFQNIVPISLYISIEIVKTIQAYFINQDIDMYYEPYDTCCVPKTWNISDDLGQIEYVFSDKTGTLTQNVMEFQKCSVHGVAYGEGVTEAMRGQAKREGRSDLMSPAEQARKLEAQKEEMLQKMSKAFKNRYLRPDQLTLVSPQLADDLSDRSKPQRGHLIAFFRALAICHTGKIILYCKGADSVIYARLAADHDQELKAATAKDMETFANGGLRTLCIAYRYLTEEQYFEWSRTHDAAAAAVKDREDEIERAAAMIEQDLHILGATALEDKLQEGVPEAIETLHQAGIKLWILTGKVRRPTAATGEGLTRIFVGDKLQTAIEIGYSCNLLKNDMEVMILSADSQDAARMQIEGGLNKIASVLGPPTRDTLQNNAKRSFAVVIDGDTLRYALDETLKPLFLNLGTQCDTVVCCRVSPAQKALTVKLVKEGRNAMTLSIGDGANDVAMIQEANIGCGLIGLEGSQAAMSADYAFGQFRFLTKLLLVHGRWSYQRVADMHSNFFYKNVIWTFAMFWYLFYNSWDATYLYQYTFILLYNLAFTSLPVIVMGAFDQDINAKASLAYPQLYRRGILGLEYTRAKFWAYMADGLYQSAVVYFFPYMVWFPGNAVSWNGKTIDSLADFGTTVSVAAIICANIFVGLNTSYWTWIMWFVTIGSSLFMILWIMVYSAFESVDFNNEFILLFSTVDFLATLVLTVMISLAPRYLYKYAARTYHPLDKDIVREMWVQGDLKDRLGLNHRGKTNSRSEKLSLFRKHHLSNESEMELPTRGVYEPTMNRSPVEPQEWAAPKDNSGATLNPIQPPTSHNRADDGRPLTPGSPAADNRYSYYAASQLPSPAPTPISPEPPRHMVATPTPQPAHLSPSPYDIRPPFHSAESSRASHLTEATYTTADEWVEVDQGSGRATPHAL